MQGRKASVTTYTKLRQQECLQRPKLPICFCTACPPSTLSIKFLSPLRSSQSILREAKRRPRKQHGTRRDSSEAVGFVLCHIFLCVPSGPLAIALQPSLQLKWAFVLCFAISSSFHQWAPGHCPSVLRVARMGVCNIMCLCVSRI